MKHLLPHIIYVACVALDASSSVISGVGSTRSCSTVGNYKIIPDSLDTNLWIVFAKKESSITFDGDKEHKEC